MKNIFPHKRLAFVTIIMAISVFILTQCVENKQEEKKIIKNLKGQEYAETASCRNCHREIYDSFSTTMHHLASGLASKDYIKGSFNVPENVFVLDSLQQVVMEERTNGLYQAARINGRETRAQRFDIVIGSGKKGQTYLYWTNGELNQLPVSYLASAHSWVNSPGYSPKEIFFDRGIEARCMECHTTITKKEIYTSFYLPDQIIYGVDCERCHGPAAEHVTFHSQNPDEKKGRFIINTALLSRQQALDACGMCHSGIIQNKTPVFSFQPGDTLEHHFYKNNTTTDTSLDVHANQYGLLASSKCFIVSGTMTCSSCHNPHVKEKGDLSVYSQKCMGCHSVNNHNFCTLQPTQGFSLEANCINCHMPNKDSRIINMLSSGTAALIPEVVRSHRIAVYPQETKKWMGIH